jgi:Ca2+-binding EF-hand superfamily protein
MSQGVQARLLHRNRVKGLVGGEDRINYVEALSGLTVEQLLGKDYGTETIVPRDASPDAQNRLTKEAIESLQDDQSSMIPDVMTKATNA